MTPMAQSIQPNLDTLSLKPFTESTILNDENVPILMGLVKATAMNYARKNFRYTPQFIDECVAEAYFWLVIIYEECQEELKTHEEPIAFIRKKIAYKLKEYWAPYATSTMSFVRKQGKRLPETVQLNDEQFAKESNDIGCFICLQSILRCDLEWAVYEQYILHKTFKQIATALDIRVKRVQKILARIRRRLKYKTQEKVENDE